MRAQRRTLLTSSRSLGQLRAWLPFAQVDRRCEMRSVAFLVPWAFPGTNPEAQPNFCTARAREKPQRLSEAGFPEEDFGPE